MARTRHLWLYYAIYDFSKETYRLEVELPKALKYDLGQEACQSAIKMLKCVVIANASGENGSHLARLLVEIDVQWAVAFLNVQCESCHNEHLVAFSCKRRGFCPSCGGRRISETAIHLVDHALPIKPVRQWVMRFPIQLRLLLAIRLKFMGQILHAASPGL